MSRSSVVVLRVDEGPAFSGPVSEWLSPSEAERLSRIPSARRQSEFLAARFALRRLLAQHCPATRWQDWMLDWQDNAPPGVTQCVGVEAGVAQSLSLSLSHSGRLIACAVSNGAVGIDLEVQTKPRHVSGLMEMVCTPQEQQRIESLEPQAQRAAFDVLWTLKEAWFKRERTGIDLSRIRYLQTHQISRHTSNTPHPIATNPEHLLSPNAQVWQGCCEGRGYTVALCQNNLAGGAVSWVNEGIEAPSCVATWAVVPA